MCTGWLVKDVAARDQHDMRALFFELVACWPLTTMLSESTAGVSKTKKEVQDLVKSLNIQFDNLCQVRRTCFQHCFKLPHTAS
jgi:hypothetical protein